MSLKICDLHTHSTFSDGTLTPTELVAAAKAAGLSAIALTDHNTVAGLPQFLAAAEACDSCAIPGIEISAACGEREMHIVGLGIRPACFSDVAAHLAPFRTAKEESTRRLVEALSAGGYRLDYRAIAAETEGQPNRAHVAAALVGAGYVATVDEAFEKLLDKRHGFYREPARPTPRETVALLHAVGARAVLAHPFYDFDESELCAFLDEAMGWEERPDGMETLYVEYTPAEEEAATRVAARYSLLPSGGSDFHGDRKPGVALGRGHGNLLIPYSLWENLKS